MNLINPSLYELHPMASGKREYYQSKVTLLDLFAAASRAAYTEGLTTLRTRQELEALQQVMKEEGVENTVQLVAKWCYRDAKALLAEREKVMEEMMGAEE